MDDKLKIGFLGNTNNYPFTLARAMRDMGYEVIFFVDSKKRLHRPEYRDDQVSYPYPEWIIETSPMGGWVAFPKLFNREVIRKLNECDLVILNSFAPIISKHIRPPKITILTGADLISLANWKTIRSDAFVKPRTFYDLLFRFTSPIIIARQREGIKSSIAVSYFPKGVDPIGDKILTELGIDEGRRLFLLMSDPQRMKYSIPKKKKKLVLLCAARLNWVKEKNSGLNHWGFKGTDIMLKGVADFIKIYDGEVELRLFRKGAHVQETIDLVKELGIEKNVIFNAEVTQLQLIEEYRNADIIFDQFSDTMIGMAGLDALCLGRPLIARARDDVYLKPFNIRSNPICNASTPEDIVTQLKRLTDDKERLRVGIESRKFAEKYLSPKYFAGLFIDRYKAHIRSR